MNAELLLYLIIYKRGFMDVQCLKYANKSLLYVVFTCMFVAFTLHLQRRKRKDCSFSLKDALLCVMYNLKTNK